jgi:hypothetical protein
MLEFITDNEMFLNETPAMIGQETDAAERMRKSREKRKKNQLECNTVTEDSNNVQESYEEVTGELLSVKNSYLDIDIEQELNTELETEKKEPAEAEASLSFEDFWQAYPRKVGKKSAETAYKKIKPSQRLFAKMIETIEAFKKSKQWQDENGRFIPNPSTWLNQGRWDDEIPDPITQSPIAGARDIPETNNPFLKMAMEGVFDDE